jgi:hypothetical protein
MIKFDDDGKIVPTDKQLRKIERDPQYRGRSDAELWRLAQVLAFGEDTVPRLVTLDEPRKPRKPRKRR